MKKLSVALFACFSLVAGVFAQEKQNAQEEAYQRQENRTISPVVFAFSGDDTIDIIGLRLSVWGSCHNLTGMDLSIGGEAQNAYGLQLALLRNKVKDVAGALQVALLINSATELAGGQISLFWNETLLARGFQIGLVNSTHDLRGLQIGLVNSAETTYGYQIGLINVIKGSTVPFFPGINFQFAED